MRTQRCCTGRAESFSHDELQHGTRGTPTRPRTENHRYGPPPSGRVETREQREYLQAALDQLSPDLREAVILRDLNDLDYEEVAAVLSVPQGTVKSRINRGRLELAKALKRMEGMEGQKSG